MTHESICLELTPGYEHTYWEGCYHGFAVPEIWSVRFWFDVHRLDLSRTDSRLMLCKAIQLRSRRVKLRARSLSP